MSEIQVHTHILGPIVIEGYGYAVRDGGFLHVLGDGGCEVAVFAAGTWSFAQLVQGEAE